MTYAVKTPHEQWEAQVLENSNRALQIVKLHRELEDLKRAREKGQELEIRLYSNLIGKVR